MEGVNKNNAAVEETAALNTEAAVTSDKVETVQEAGEVVETTSKKNMVKLEALESLAGKFKMPWDKGQKFLCEKKQAAELVEAGSAKYVK